LCILNIPPFIRKDKLRWIRETSTAGYLDRDSNIKSSQHIGWLDPKFIQLIIMVFYSSVISSA